MRVVVDARPAVSAGMTGVGFYTRELLLRLPEVDPRTTYVAWYLNARKALRPWRWSRRRLPPRPNLRERWVPIPARLFERLSMRYELPRLEWTARFDVMFAPNFVPPPTRSRRLVVTVHDLAYRLQPETAPLATRRWLARLDRALRQASRVIVPSEATRADLLEHHPLDPQRVAVIHHAVDLDRYRPAPAARVEAARRRYGIDRPYLLFVGGIEPRKNLPAIVGAFASLPDDATLVIAGGSVSWNPEGRNLLGDALNALAPGVRRRVNLTGYLSEDDKVALLTGAEALVYPSLYEGFGFPVLEAMACGTPVLTSSVSSLPEVAGEAALVVDPRSQEAIAEGMSRLLHDEALRSKLVEAGQERVGLFTWDRTAQETARILHEAAGD